MTLAFVVPVYGGELFLRGLVDAQERFRQELEGSGAAIRHLESIFVCDEPIDRSSELLIDLARSRPWLTVIHLARNMGQHGATAAGMLHTSADWVVTMDEDGQHEPAHVPLMLAAVMKSQADVCYAKPVGPVHENGWRNSSSRAAKRLVSLLVNDPVVTCFNSFRLVRGDIARAAAALASPDLYLDVALRWFTNRVVTTDLALRDPRGPTHRSGYSFRSLLEHFRRLLMSYNLTVLRHLTTFGFGAAIVFGLLGAFNLALKLISPERVPVQGWTSVFVTISFFGGLTTFLLGLILERLATMLTKAQGRPAFYVVDRSRDSLWHQEDARDLPAKQETT